MHNTPSTISELTEPEYLKPRRSVDPIRAWLTNLCAIVALVIEHAENALPTLFDDDPNRACFAWSTFYRFTEADDADDIGTRTYRNILNRVGVSNAGGVLRVEDWSTIQLIADALDGEVLTGQTATSSAPRVLTTTMGHRAGLDGTLKTYRRHMPIVDSMGNLADALDLTRQANDLLRISIHATDDTSWMLEGTQDRAFNDDHAHAARGSQGRVKLKVARPAATYRHGSRVIVVDSEGTATLTTRCEARYDRRKIIGHGSWIEPAARVRNQPTSSKARKARASSKANATIQVDAANAPEVCAEVAMAMWNARTTSSVGDTADAQNHARQTLVTNSGVKITVGLSAKGYDVVIVPPTGKRARTSTSAPEYVERIVRNRLALIG